MVRLELSGRLVRDAEVKTTSNGNEVAKISVAVNVTYKEIESAFFDVVCWSPYSGVVKNLKKGSPIYLVATPRTEKWDKDGKSFSKQVWYPVTIQLPEGGPRAAASTAAAEPAKEKDDDDNVPF